MLYQFKSEEAINKFVSSTPYTDRHNIIFASIVGLDPFKANLREEYKDLMGMWVSKGGQDFYIIQFEMKYFKKLAE